MKKIITLCIAVLFITASASAVRRNTKNYAPDQIGLHGKVKTPVTVTIVNPKKASSIDRTQGDIIGWLDDETCGAQGNEACAVIHDPQGLHYVKEVSVNGKKANGYVGDIRGSKIKHTGDKTAKVLRVYRFGEGESLENMKNGKSLKKPGKSAIKKPYVTGTPMLPSKTHAPVTSPDGAGNLVNRSLINY